MTTHPKTLLQYFFIILIAVVTIHVAGGLSKVHMPPGVLCPQ
jgi:hypothetical protein